MVRVGIIGILLTILPFQTLIARVIYIPAEYSTIGAGIDISAENDTVLISPGIYHENINLNSHAITLSSMYLLTGDTAYISTTTIDGSQAAPVISMNFPGQSSALISGLTITNGLGSFGGGIAVNGCRGRINDNVIHDNQTQVYGSAIYSINSPNIEISRNTIYGNSGNVGAIFIHNSVFRVDHNLVFGNLSAIALEFFQTNSGIVLNNTFTDNQCGEYGQIVINAESEMSIINNIITSSARYGIYFFDNFNIPCLYNDVWGNESGNYFRATPGTGSISDNPLFGDNYNLEITSPCIDTGDPSTAPDPDGTIADIGARFYDQGQRIYQFHLIEPIDHEIVNSPFQALIWNATSAVDTGHTISYNVFWDTNPNFASAESSGAIFDTSYIRPDGFTRSTNYYWRILASDNNSEPLYSVETWSFYLDGIPGVPEIISPENGTMAADSTVLAWFLASDPDSFDFVTYTLQLDNDPDFSSPAIIQYGLGPEITSDDAMGIRINQLDDYETLAPNIRYFWRLRSDDAFGISSAWTSGENYFYYLWQNHAPEPFLLSSPENGDRQINESIRFCWYSATDQDPNSTITYIIECAPDSLFQGLLFSISGISDTAIIFATDSLALLEPMLYWRIMAVDNNGLIRVGGIPEGARLLFIAAPGDANSSGRLSGVDIIFLKNYIYNQGPAPIPLLSGDFNSDCQLNSLDISAMILFFKGFGPPPQRPDCQR